MEIQQNVAEQQSTTGAKAGSWVKQVIITREGDKYTIPAIRVGRILGPISRWRANRAITRYYENRSKRLTGADKAAFKKVIEDYRRSMVHG